MRSWEVLYKSIFVYYYSTLLLTGDPRKERDSLVSGLSFPKGFSAGITKRTRSSRHGNTRTHLHVWQIIVS